MTSFYLAICEIHNSPLHGMDKDSDPNIENHFLVNEIFSIEDFYNSTYIEAIIHLNHRYQLYIQRWYQWHIQGNGNDRIPNYYHIIRHPNYIKLDIIQLDRGRGNEYIAYVKTYWLRLIQRRWKNIYAQRKNILKQRKTNYAINHRKIYGKWPKALQTWPPFHLNLSI